MADDVKSGFKLLEFDFHDLTLRTLTTEIRFAFNFCQLKFPPHYLCFPKTLSYRFEISNLVHTKCYLQLDVFQNNIPKPKKEIEI